MQERHISSLFSQAQQLSQQLISARTDASTAQAAAAAARQAAATLSLQLESAVSEAEALRRAAAAATQEAAGVAQWCLSRPPGSSLQGGSSGSNGGCGEESVGEVLRRRDEGLIKWFEARVGGLLKQQQGHDQQQQEDSRLIALVREVSTVHRATAIDADRLWLVLAPCLQFASRGRVCCGKTHMVLVMLPLVCCQFGMQARRLPLSPF
jgi:hypothetical protein